MDGRDIGTTVLPDAEVKVFMTATVEERARRSFKEMDPSEGHDVGTDGARHRHSVIRLDQEREISPLRQC